ncbi:reverse transcriptase domain-containing protein [Tanacetum coccineum]
MVVEEEGPTWMNPIRNYLEKGMLPEDPVDARTLMEKIGNYTLKDRVMYKKSYLVSLMRCVGPLKANYVIREVHMGACRMHDGPRFGIQATIITDNGTQFVNDPFKKWAKKLKIKLISTSVYHPYGNGAVKRANRSLLKGIKTRLEKGGLTWVEEIGMPTHITSKLNAKTSDKELRLNLDLLEERREISAIREARYKQQVEKYYNKKEGPYKVIQAFQSRAYKLSNMEGEEIHRTWHTLTQTAEEAPDPEGFFLFKCSGVLVFDTGRDALMSHVTEPKDTDFCMDEPHDTEHEEDGYISSDGGDENLVNGYYYDAQVGGTAGDEFQREILPPAPGPYYMPYPYDEGSSDSPPPYTKEEWDGVHTMNLGLLNKEFLKILRKFKADRTTKEVIAAKKEKVDEELVKAKSQLELQETELKELKYQLSQLESDTHLHNDIISSHEKQAKEVRSGVTSFFQSNFESIICRFLKSGEFNHAFEDVISLAKSVGVEQGLRMDHSDTEFKKISRRVANFIPNTQEKFDDAVAAFPTKTFPFLWQSVLECREFLVRHCSSPLPDTALEFFLPTLVFLVTLVDTFGRVEAFRLVAFLAFVTTP